jgi:hypothetical protein
LRLAVGTHAHLKAFLLALFAAQADGRCFRPRILRNSLLVFGNGLFQVSDSLLQIGILRSEHGRNRISRETVTAITAGKKILRGNIVSRRSICPSWLQL